MMLSPLFVAIIAFSFFIIMGVLWEFLEFRMDKFTQTDMQKDRVIQSISTVELHPEGKKYTYKIDNINNTEINYLDKKNNLCWRI